MIDRGVKLYATDTEGMTALMRACVAGKEDSRSLTSAKVLNKHLQNALIAKVWLFLFRFCHCKMQFCMKFKVIAQHITTSFLLDLTICNPQNKRIFCKAGHKFIKCILTLTL